jgi:hypothetical protein
MKAQVQILAQGVRRSFKEGKFIMHECQCVVLGDAVQVGVLKINDKIADAILQEVTIEGQKVRVVPAGGYELEYGLGISWDTKELGGHLKSITRVGAGNSVLADLGKDKVAAKAS